MLEIIKYSAEQFNIDFDNQDLVILINYYLEHGENDFLDFKALNFKMVRGSRINTGVRNVCIGARKYYRELKRA